MRKIAVAVTVLLTGFGVALADQQFGGSMKKISDDGKEIVVNKKKNKKDKEGEDITLKVDANCKVLSATFNKDAKKFEAGDKLEGGLKNEAFAKIGTKGIAVRVVADDDGKVAKEIWLVKKK